MKNSKFENFFVVVNNPRALYRDFENNNENDLNKNKYFPAPILLFHPIKKSYSKITFNKGSGLRQLDILKEIYGVNAILTCLNNNDYCNQIESLIINNDLIHFKFQLNFIKLQELKTKILKDKFISDIIYLYQKLLNENLTLLIHSAAGDMKTGIIVYSLLRLNDEKREDSIDIIKNLREEKKLSIGDFNLEFLEENVIPYLKNEYKNVELLNNS